MDRLKIMNIVDRRMSLVLIGLNVLCFVAVNMSIAIGDAGAAAFFALPASLDALLSRPWTIVLYMFTQWNLIHLLVNMLWLWCWCRITEMTEAGAIVGNGLRVACAYIWGGLTGALVYEIAASCGMPCGICLTGSSAAVVGVIGAGAVNAGRGEVNLVLFGRVRLIWAAVAAVGLCLLGDLSGDAGTALAHAGGLVGGIAYGLWLKYRSLAVGTGLLRHDIGQTGDDNADLDAILAKVGRSGYGSLSAGERNRLFEITRRMK